MNFRVEGALDLRLRQMNGPKVSFRTSRVRFDGRIGLSVLVFCIDLMNRSQLLCPGKIGFRNGGFTIFPPLLVPIFCSRYFIVLGVSISFELLVFN
jgi:hypothetical protein